VDPKFDVIVNMTDKKEQDNFRNYCKLFNGLGNLGFPQFVKDDNSISQFKGILYLFYLLVLPMNQQVSLLIFATAVLVSFLQRNRMIGDEKTNGITYIQTILEEEVMNIFLSILTYLSGSTMKLLIHACLIPWSIIHVASHADQ
jgi:hypothetical protein